MILQQNFTMQPLLTSLGKSLPKEIQTGTSASLTYVIILNYIIILNKPSKIRETNYYTVFLSIVYQINL